VKKNRQCGQLSKKIDEEGGGGATKTMHSLLRKEEAHDNGGGRGATVRGTRDAHSKVARQEGKKKTTTV